MILTAEQMRTVEAKAVSLGLSWLRLMENAGSAAAKVIRDTCPLKGQKIVIVCGKGNNGGDGYVIARKLLEDKASVRVISVSAPATASAVEMASKAYALGIKPIDFENYEPLCCQYIKDADIVIDAVFGTGFKGEPSGIYANAVNAINSSNGYKIAIDVPSGMSSDSGYNSGVFVTADLTVTFAALKPCHISFPSSEYCGKVVIASIGIPDEAFNCVNPIMRVVKKDDVRLALPKRKTNFHKGDCGTAALYCGSLGMAGAAVIAGKACIKSGVGIADMIIPQSIYNIVGTSLPEAVCTVIDDVENGKVNDAVTERVINTVDKCNVGLIGCGLGQSNQAKYTVLEIMKNCSVPLIIDADGINILSENTHLIKQYTNDVVITPHPKEASRLLKCSVDDIQNDRLGSAMRLAKEFNSVAVLKGAKIIISLPNGENFVVTDGNPGMATAGSGDMLAGMIAAFISQGLTAAESAICAVKIHAMAGDIAVEDTSVLSLTPTDMINTLTTVFCRMYLTK